jgi:hypothetical protein
MKKMSTITAAAIALLFSVSTWAGTEGHDEKPAETPMMGTGQDSSSDSLNERIKILEARLAAVEARHTFASFMPNLAERFHVMHRAGEAGDWAVAAHELQEMKRVTKLSTAVDAEKGELMNAMMDPSLESLEQAIGEGNIENFNKALDQTLSTCNACHVATDSGFVQVSMDAQGSLSMRHPHSFLAQQAPKGHGHGEPTGMEDGEHMEEAGAMHMEDAGAMHKDDADAPAHTD